MSLKKDLQILLEKTKIKSIPVSEIQQILEDNKYEDARSMTWDGCLFEGPISDVEIKSYEPD